MGKRQRHGCGHENRRTSENTTWAESAVLPHRNLESLTFREKIHDIRALARSLGEHLDQSLLPRARRIRTILRTSPASEQEIPEDVTVRNLVSNLLESAHIASTLFDRVDQLGVAIETDSHAMLRAENSRPRKK